MNLLVIGATGRTGRHVLTQGMQRGHAITAFARRPQALRGVDGLAAIVHGDALNLDDVHRAVVGQDAVITIGNSGIVSNLLISMAEIGVRRVVMMSSRSVVATQPKLVIGLVWLYFRAPYADLARAEGMLQASDVDWSIVRATMLNDKPGSRHVHIDTEPNATGGDWQLSRADYAMTLLDVVEQRSMIGQAIGVGNAKRRPTRAGSPASRGSGSRAASPERPAK